MSNDTLEDTFTPPPLPRTPTKTNQPNLNENKQTDSHVGKILASNGTKNGGNINEIYVIWH